MHFLLNTRTDPYFNLALEEYLLKSREEEFFSLWRNAPSVIIGRNQDALAEINLDFLNDNDIALVRRMSGGGAVFHDLGNINFTYITKYEKGDFFNFARFADPVLKALAGLNIPAEASGRNDLTVDGKKFSGNAQHLHRGRLLHHGTLLFGSNFDYMQGALNVDPDKLAGKGVASVKSRVTNLENYCNGMSVEAFIDYLSRSVPKYFPGCKRYELTAADIAAAEKLAGEKYRSDRWNLLHMGDYSFSAAARYPAGKIRLSFDVAGGCISRLSISGDFFGMNDITQLESALIGVTHTKDALARAMDDADIGRCISGISSDELLPLFF